ncbi:MAG: hypothetical protein U9O86_01140 [Campylobacterota bacterium]|nr:hypothetical protein [Campylobacterota bacterium]
MKTLLLLLTTFILFIGCSRVSDEELRKAHIAYENGALIVDRRV